MSLEVKTCRSCGEEIIWATTAGGKRMPFDAEPVSYPKGLFVLTGHPNAPQAVSLQRHLDTMPLFVSHFASCPNADTHRKEKP